MAGLGRAGDAGIPSGSGGGVCDSGTAGREADLLIPGPAVRPGKCPALDLSYPSTRSNTSIGGGLWRGAPRRKRQDEALWTLHVM